MAALRASRESSTGSGPPVRRALRHIRAIADVQGDQRAVARLRRHSGRCARPRMVAGDRSPLRASVAGAWNVSNEAPCPFDEEAGRPRQRAEDEKVCPEARGYASMSEGLRD